MSRPSFSTYDPYDAEWEDPNTGRTVYRPSEDDDYCEGCDGPIKNDRCACDDDEIVDRGAGASEIAGRLFTSRYPTTKGTT